MFFALAAYISRPPSSLGLIILLQPTKCSFFFSVDEPQRKSLFILSSFSHNWLGSATPCITWLGSTVMTDLMSTILPTKERNFSFHPESFEITLSTMKLCLFQAAPLGFKEKPKYFLIHEVSEMSRTIYFVHVLCVCEYLLIS